MLRFAKAGTAFRASSRRSFSSTRLPKYEPLQSLSPDYGRQEQQQGARCLSTATVAAVGRPQYRGEQGGWQQRQQAWQGLGASRSLSSSTPPAVGGEKDKEEIQKEEGNKKGLMHRWFGPKSAQASPGTNRWSVVVPACIAHVCIGSPYGWSIMSGTLSRELGLVAEAAGDWSMADSTFPIQLVFAMQGISAAVAGKWAMDAGPRKAMTTAAACFGGGLALGGLGISLHSLPLLYLGYGFLGGIGVGLAYTPPLQALISWFPDRRGLASGMCIAGFGSGALVFAPLANKLMDTFMVSPTYLGAVSQVDIVLKEGRRWAESGGELVEVVTANAADIAKLSCDMAEGVYVVGSGNSGAAATLMVAGGVYGTAMLASAFTIRTPPPGYKVEGYTPPEPAPSAAKEEKQDLVAAGNVTPNQVMTTPQFYLLGTTFASMAAGGIALLSVAKPMMGDIFSTLLPGVVTAAFASQYVGVLGAANLGGRLVWASFSDKFGRRTTFHVFTMASIPLYLSVPFLVNQVVTTSSALPMYLFVGNTFLAISIMGGLYSVLPAYEGDLFGTKYVGPTHGRMLLFSSTAALGGPSLLMALKARSESAAIADLLSKADPAKFLERFGSPISESAALLESKTLTISRLLDTTPVGTVDPSPFLYDSTMYTMAGLMTVATVSHALVKPVPSKYFEKEDVVVEGVFKEATGFSLPAPGASPSAVMLPSMASHMIPTYKPRTD